MLKYLKLGISALAISALFLAPAVTVTLITADAAYANNGNGNGNGGGNRGGGNGGGAGKGGDKGAGGDSNKNAKGNKGFGIFKGKGNKGAKNKSASKGGFGKGLKDFGNSFKNDVGKLFGAKPKKKATTKSVSRPVKSSKTPKARSSAAEFAQRKGTMHPSNLGKLNGAINSSPRAKQAHIENGQFMKGSGPVSLAAALAVADYNKTEVVGAVHTLELADAFETIANTDETQLMNAEQAIKDYNQFIKDKPDTDVP